VIRKKEVITTIKQTSDQGWQQLQTHIEGFLGQALRNDAQRIEYKPRFIDHLLEMPSERHQNELHSRMGRSDNFGKKEVEHE
jgi:hypothetical protein